MTRVSDLSDRVAALLAAGQADEARALVDSVAAREPAAAELARAALGLFDQDPDAVIDHAERAIRLGAGGTGHQYVALGHLVAEDADGAIAHARKAVELDPTVRARSTLAAVLLTTGHADEAAAILRELRDEQPRDADVALNLGTAAAELENYGEAIVSYAQAFDLRPRDPRPITQLLEMFAEVGKWLGAAAALDLSRSGEPPPEVEVALGLVQVRLVQLIAQGFPERDVDRDTDRAVAKLVASALARGPETQLAVAQTLFEVERDGDARTLVASAAANPAYTPLDAATSGQLKQLQAQLAARAGQPSGSPAHPGPAISDARRTEACRQAISVLLDDGSADALAQIPQWLERVPAADRQLDPALGLYEAMYFARTDRAPEARDRLQQVFKLTGDMGPVAARAGKLRDQLAAAT
jgi:tetratricopeptide (TPR) repeat protein